MISFNLNGICEESAVDNVLSRHFQHEIDMDGVIRETPPLPRPPLPSRGPWQLPDNNLGSSSLIQPIAFPQEQFGLHVGIKFNIEGRAVAKNANSNRADAVMSALNQHHIIVAAVDDLAFDTERCDAVQRETG